MTKNIFFILIWGGLLKNTWVFWGKLQGIVILPVSGISQASEKQDVLSLPPSLPLFLPLSLTLFLSLSYTQTYIHTERHTQTDTQTHKQKPPTSLQMLGLFLVLSLCSLALIALLECYSYLWCIFVSCFSNCTKLESWFLFIFTSFVVLDEFLTIV